MKRNATFLLTLATLTVLALNVSAQDLLLREQHVLERRAVDAVIWGMPIVSLDAMRQAYFRDGKAKYGDIIWWPKGNAWKNQSLTPNTSVRYLYTKDAGPVVLDLPAATNGLTRRCSSLLTRRSWPGWGVANVVSSTSRVLPLLPRDQSAEPR
jgi:hypothetical protein